MSSDSPVKSDEPRSASLIPPFGGRIMARPGLRLVAYALESATNVKTAVSGEIDDQLFIRRALYGFGLGQGMYYKRRWLQKNHNSNKLQKYRYIQIEPVVGPEADDFWHESCFRFTAIPVCLKSIMPVLCSAFFQ